MENRDIPRAGVGGFWVGLDGPYNAVGVARADLSDKDIWFIHKVSLSFITEKHFGER